MTYKQEAIGDTKVCTTCGIRKSFSEYYKDSRRKNGMQPRCKKCHLNSGMKYQKTERGKGVHKKANIKYSPKQREIRRANKATTMIYAAKSRAKKRGVPCTITISDIHIPAICPVFKVPFAHGEDGKNVADMLFRPMSPSLDCIIPELGYIPGNIQVISYLANVMKHNATPEQLVQFAQWVLTEFTEKCNGLSSKSKTVA